MNTLSINQPPPACGAETIDGVATAGCGDLYADWRWNSKKYFDARNGSWTGTVKIGTVEQGALDAAGKAPAAKKP